MEGFVPCLTVPAIKPLAENGKNCEAIFTVFRLRLTDVKLAVGANHQQLIWDLESNSFSLDRYLGSSYYITY